MRLTKEQLKQDLKLNKDINIYISDRAGWKSTTVQLYMIDEAIKGNPFVLIRSMTDEDITEQWLSEHTLEYMKSKGLHCKSKKISTYISSLILYNDECEYILCYGLYVSVARKYKSNYYKGFEKVKYIVWEECVTDKPLVQNVSYCKSRYFEQLNNVLSIGSTVSRGRNIQYIFLGNDISTNIINSVTVGFNLLERLHINKRIIDTTSINDKMYSFLFLYFDFDGAVNHWLNVPNLDISVDIDTHNLGTYPFILITKFNKYFIYKAKNYLHICDKKPKTIKSVITSTEEFFEFYDAMDLLKYPLDIALNLLATYYDVSYDFIKKYFGDKWQTYPRFRECIKFQENSIINIEEISNIKTASILNLQNFNDIQEFVSLLKNSTVIYSNMHIKILCEELKDKLLLI